MPPQEVAFHSTETEVSARQAVTTKLLAVRSMYRKLVARVVQVYSQNGEGKRIRFTFPS